MTEISAKKTDNGKISAFSNPNRRRPISVCQTLARLCRGWLYRRRHSANDKLLMRSMLRMLIVTFVITTVTFLIITTVVGNIKLASR